MRQICGHLSAHYAVDVSKIAPRRYYGKFGTIYGYIVEYTTEFCNGDYPDLRHTVVYPRAGKRYADIFYNSIVQDFRSKDCMYTSAHYYVELYSGARIMRRGYRSSTLWIRDNK
jgi:hypothetical protein